MAREGANIGVEATISSAFTILMVESGVGAIPVAVWETLFNAGTSYAVLNAAKKCKKECNKECPDANE